ncbi:oligosaccharide flippase family protein, partial [Patescibacteria group bacterium]|nr:oligosaccharide flippase family protein [Patescibacteria group bacterium]
MITEYFKHSIFKGGLIFFIGGVITNILNYFYRILMGRMLGPESFGELMAVISLLFILVVPSAPLQTVSARFSAISQAQESLAKLKQFFKYLTKIMVLVGLGLIIVTIIFAQSIQNFLNLSSINYIYFLSGITVIMLIAGVSKGTLQGIKRFTQLSITTVIESVVRVVLAVVLVILGFKISGALIGFLISLIIGYLLTVYFLRDVISEPKKDSEIIKKPGKRINKKEIWQYVLKSFLVFLFLNILLNIDIILVKHYFTGFEAGIYSALSTVARIVFLLISLLAGILFPVVAFKQEKNQNYFHLLKIAVLIGLAISFFVCLILFLFSSQFIGLFFGAEYIEGSSLLGYYSLAMALFGFIFLLSYFFMALNKFKFLYILAIGSVMEVSLISIWHQNFAQIISMF